MLTLLSSIYPVWAVIFAHTFVKVFARTSIFAINYENECVRFDLCLDLWKFKQKYLRTLEFAQIFAQIPHVLPAFFNKIGFFVG